MMMIQWLSGSIQINEYVCSDDDDDDDEALMIALL